MADPTLDAQTAANYAALGAPMPLSINGVSTGSNTMSTSLQQALANIENAINSGDQKQYDLAVGQLMGIFNGQPTLEAQNDTGYVNGKPTVSLQDLQEKAREANLSTMGSLLGDAS